QSVAVTTAGTASVVVKSGLSTPDQKIGQAVQFKIVKSDDSEKDDADVLVQFGFSFNAKLFAAKNGVANFDYGVTYVYQGEPKPLIGNSYPLGGIGVTAAGPGPVDLKGGQLKAKIGQEFSVKFWANMKGQTLNAPGFVNNAGWLVDTSLDVSVSAQ